MTKDIDQIKTVFTRLKTLSPLWINGDNTYKKRLEEQLEPDFKKLESLGVARHFSEALLFYGREFVESVWKDSINRTEATVEDAEAIFNGKKRKMSSTEKKAAKMAEERGIKMYEVVTEGKKVGIVDLSPEKEEVVETKKDEHKQQNLI